jgi:uncharacterized protein
MQKNLLAITSMLFLLYHTPTLAGVEEQPHWCKVFRLIPQEETICNSPELLDLDRKAKNLAVKAKSKVDPVFILYKSMLFSRDRCDEKDQDCLSEVYVTFMERTINFLEPHSLNHFHSRNLPHTFFHAAVGKDMRLEACPFHPVGGYQKICKRLWAIERYNEISFLYQEVYSRLSNESHKIALAKERVQWEQDVLSCFDDPFCDSRLDSDMVEDLEARLSGKKPIVYIPSEWVGVCKADFYNKQTRNCTIVFGAEYSCNLAMTEEVEGVLSGRSTISSAICSAAMQELLVGEIDWVAAGISLGAGIADDLADEAATSGDWLSALLFQGTSYAAMGLGLGWCFAEVDRQCGR